MIGNVCRTVTGILIMVALYIGHKQIYSMEKYVMFALCASLLGVVTVLNMND